MTRIKNENELTLCTQCILPDTFPGIKFNEQGICKYCLQDDKKADKPKRKNEYKLKLDTLIRDTRDSASVYDVLMAYSGGKDSSYTLKILKERYNLKILALTFDNHFVSPSAIENINNVTDALGIDSIIIRPPKNLVTELFALTSKQDIFSKATLLRASSVCTSCIGLVKSLVLKTAIEMSVPLVAYGWSPGQAPIQSAIMKTNPSMMLQGQRALFNSYTGTLKDRLKQYVVPEHYFELYKDRFPTNIHPLAFFDYNEESIKKELVSIGWGNPKDTDTNSSNCLLNAYANYCHIDRHGFHPYVWEIANMVRQGIIERDEGIKKIYTEQDPKMVIYARERLGL